MLVCAFFTHFGTRDRGCSAHPAFPAPSGLRVRTRNLHHSGEIASRERGSVPSRHCERSEAIHLAAQRRNGLLRRFAPRNDGASTITRRSELYSLTPADRSDTISTR